MRMEGLEQEEEEEDGGGGSREKGGILQDGWELKRQVELFFFGFC